MPFSYLLTNLMVEVPGALGAILLDDDGEAVEWVSLHPREPYDLKVEGAYHAIFKRQIEDACRLAGGGALDSYILSGRRMMALTCPLPDGYYVVLVVRRSGYAAVARYHLRRIARNIAFELE